MKFKTIYEAGLRTHATHLPSGTTLITDAPVDNHGRGQSFSPTDLVAAGLASCLMTIMGIEAEKKGISLEGLYAETEKIMKANPRAIHKIKVMVYWPQPQASSTDIAFLKEKALTCPVALSLHPDIHQEIIFNF